MPMAIRFQISNSIIRARRQTSQRHSAFSTAIQAEAWIGSRLRRSDGVWRAVVGRLCHFGFRLRRILPRAVHT